jgi:hypothetical protein
MVYPIALENSVLYLIVSDPAEDTKLVALIGQKERNVLGKYGV